MSRRLPRPLEPPPKPAPRDQIHFAISSEQLVADVRASFPELEPWLMREYQTPLDAFAKEQPAALIYVLHRQAEEELYRRRQYIAALARAGPDPTLDTAAERFAIQNEGLEERVDRTEASDDQRGAEGPEADRLAGSP